MVYTVSTSLQPNDKTCNQLGNIQNADNTQKGFTDSVTLRISSNVFLL